MMSKCWSFNPSERPTFSELVHQTKEMITVLEQQMKQGQHTTDIDNFRNNRFISLYKVKSTSCINYL
jgi:hypothetical protein